MDKMIKENKNFPIIIENSPIDFALIGSRRDYLSILVQNDKLGIDFIGEYITRYENKEKTESNSWKSFFKLFRISTYLKVHCIKSYGIDNLLNENDERSINYIFCWRGFSSKKDIYHINKLLDLHIQNIQISILHNDKERLIWNISPIIYKCVS